MEAFEADFLALEDFLKIDFLTELFFEEMIRQDGSVLDVLDAKYTYMNERLARMAVKFGLTMTGGSDYHGRSRPHNVLGRMTDTGQPPIDQLDPWLLEMAISPVR